MKRQTLARYEKVLGAEHPDTLTSMSNLVGVLDRQGKYEEAESMHRPTLARYEKVLGAEHPHTPTSVYCLAYLLANQRRYAEATQLYERVCAGCKTVLGEEHPTTRACCQHYSDMIALQRQGQSTRSPSRLSLAHTSKKSKLTRGLAKIGILSPRIVRK